MTKVEEELLAIIRARDATIFAMRRQQRESLKRRTGDASQALANATGAPAAEYLGQDTDVRLLTLLASEVDTKFFVDVGAEKGSIARELSAHGLHGVLIEPLQEHQAALRELAAEIGCALLPIAIDEVDGERDLNVATGDDGKVLDYFHSLQRSEGSSQFHHETTRRVTCRSLASLTREGVLPQPVGILKIDTDGHDLFVLRGLGKLRPELVVCEYFTQDIYAGLETGYPGPLIELMRGYGYRRCLATKRMDEFELVQAAPLGFLPKQWGNLFFLGDGLFAKAEHALEKFIADCEAALLGRIHEISADRVAKEAVIVEMKGWAKAAEESLREKEAVIRRLDAAQLGQAATIGYRNTAIRTALDDNAAAHARSDACQHELLAQVQHLSAALAEKDSTTLALLNRLQQEGELRGDTLRALLNGQTGASEPTEKPSSVDSHASLIAALEEKERVIRGLADAVDAYRAAHPVLGYVATPLRWLMGMPRKVRTSAYAMLKPRLGSLCQHAPIDVRLPDHYRRQGSPKNPPRISIVTPSYKQAAFLEPTLKSVLDQGYPNLEYFVQDGDSDDGTREILQRYSDQLSGWESQADGGQSHAINLGFARTSGEIMAWLNSDDILFPGALAYVASYFMDHPEVDVVYGHRLLIDENDQQIGRWIMPAHDDEVLSWADFVPQETLFWRRSIWDKAGATIDESFRFAMDWDLLLRMRAAGAKFVRLPRMIGGFRIHTRQKTSAAISNVGFQEMARIRERELNGAPTSFQINRAKNPYLIHNTGSDLVWRLSHR